jgi:hypothetical protein
LPKEKREHSTISQAASSECGTQTQDIHEPSPFPTRKNIQIQNTDEAKPSTSTDSTEIHPPPVKKRRFHQHPKENRIFPKKKKKTIVGINHQGLSTLFYS